MKFASSGPYLDQAGTFGAMVKMLLLTAQRRDEVAHMSRNEIDKDGIWVIPAERYKTKRPNHVPLSKAALALIEAQPKPGDCDLIFPSRARRLTRVSPRARLSWIRPYLRR